MSSTRDQRKQLYEQLVGQPVANGRFEITSLLGFGGMGAVYEAIQKNMDRKVALKLIPTHDPTIVARFEREALTISKLVHPNTITVFDFGQSEDGFLFLSMELLEGTTLTDEIKRGPMTARRAVHIASQMCRSLAEAHRAGIVHRDIKPDNIILISVDDDPDVVKVLDFGIAKAVMGEDDVQLTGDGRIIGTPRYMSPEQILAEPLDHRSDIYSLGCILFEMLCGAPPFQQSSTTALMISHTQDPPPAFAAQLDTGSMSHIPPGLERVVRRALAKHPDDRPRDCDQLREELEAAMAGLIMHDSEETAVGAKVRAVGSFSSTHSSPAPQQGSNKAVVVGLVALLVFAIGIGTFVATGGGGEASGEPETPVEAPSALVAEAPVDEPSDEPEEVPQPPPQPEGDAIAMLKIDSIPTAVRVYDGNAFLGKTPMSIPVRAELNEYNYKLVQQGYEDLPVSIRVSPLDKDKEVVREFELKKQAAKVSKRNTKQRTKPAPVAEAKTEDSPKKNNKARRWTCLKDGPKADGETASRTNE